MISEEFGIWNNSWKLGIVHKILAKMTIILFAIFVCQNVPVLLDQNVSISAHQNVSVIYKVIFIENISRHFCVVKYERIAIAQNHCQHCTFFLENFCVQNVWISSTPVLLPPWKQDNDPISAKFAAQILSLNLDYIFIYLFIYFFVLNFLITGLCIFELFLHLHWLSLLILFSNHKTYTPYLLILFDSIMLWIWCNFTRFNFQNVVWKSFIS